MAAYSSGVRTLRRRGLDWVLVGLYLGVVLIGWLTLASTEMVEGQSLFNFDLNSSLGRQTIWILISIVAFGLATTIDWKFWGSFSFIFYSISILLLVLLFVFGREIKGATSWFSVFGFSFQPSEIAKWTTCLALASYLSSSNISLTNKKHIIFAFLIFLIPSFLILMQPDAGSALIFFAFLFVFYRAGFYPAFFAASIALSLNFVGSLLFGPKLMLILILSTISLVFTFNLRKPKNFIAPLFLSYLAIFIFYREGYENYVIIASILITLAFAALNTLEQKARTVVAVLALGILAIAISYGTDWAFENLLKPHQQDRVNVWLHPDRCDPRGSLYNILQSKTAIGSGGLSGQGYMNGPMTQLNFVPEQETDFIFSSLGEEQGFLGILGFLSLYAFLLFRITVIAERGKNKFIQYYAYGLFGLLFIHFFINIGMTMGIMPVIGIPLAFVSKGGSSILAFSIMLGVLARMDME